MSTHLHTFNDFSLKKATFLKNAGGAGWPPSSTALRSVLQWGASRAILVLINS